MTASCVPSTPYHLSWLLPYFVHSFILCCFYLINSRLQYEGTPKYLGESVTGSESQDMELMRWFMCIADIVVRNNWQGCRWMHRQVSMTLLCMHKVFPTRKGEQMIVMSFSDVTVIHTHVEGWEYKRRACTWALGLLSGFLAAVHLVTSCEKLHGPTPAAILVPLQEWDYNCTGKCLCLFNCKCLRLS